MPKIFSVFPNYSTFNALVGDPSHLGGLSYAWSNGGMTDIIDALGKTPGYYSMQQLKDSCINGYAAYFSGARVIDASKFVSVSPDLAPHHLDDWMGFTGYNVQEPWCQNNLETIVFSSTGFKNFMFVMNQGEVNWDQSGAGAAQQTHVHVFNEPSPIYSFPSQLAGSQAIPPASNIVLVSCSDNITTLVDKTKYYYG